ncbi:unnamed protein product [Durusdinium trenchii]|uniref:Hexosyltransferase n=1 Tax=Durusdinium trenchii TaxID=1381693 RepID=A0ABP0MHI8_9DINO
MWIGWFLPPVAAYHAHDHSCGWTNKQVLWRRLRQRADAVLAGATAWSRESWVDQIAEELVNCPLGVHVIELLDAETKSLDLSRSRQMGFGLYNVVSLWNIALTGWPTFGLLHRLCRRAFANSTGTHRPARGAFVVRAAQRARRRYESNASRGVSDLELLHSLEVDLNQLRSSWFARFDGGGAPVTEVATRWLGLDAMEPSCEMWAELATLQRQLRHRFELPCASGARRLDGAVCPGCRLAAQGFWLDERRVAEAALAQLGLPGQPEEPAARAAERRAPGAWATATVLTSEDLFRSIRHDGQGGSEDWEDATAIVLAYVDALRTLAFSLRRAGRHGAASLGPLLVLLSLRQGEALPQEARESLEALEEQGLIQLLHLPIPPQHLWPRAWGKLQLWQPRGYDLVLYLDADILVLDDLTGLFRAAAEGVDAAAALTRSMMGLNGGVMLLRPSSHIFHALRASLEELPSWKGLSRWTGRPWWNTPPETSNGSDFGSYGDQDHLSLSGEASAVCGRDEAVRSPPNEWLATSFRFAGELQPGGGCARQPWQRAYVDVRDAEPGSKQPLGTFCTLPVGFNFCATAGCLDQLASKEHHLALESLSHGWSAGRSQALPVQVLHWPGALRKPWQRCLSSTRSRLDELWWKTFQEACLEAPKAAPCRVKCFD